jgi:hypothetical protein
MNNDTNYTSKAITTQIKATSRVSAKIGDDFYTLEFSEERTIPDIEGVNLDEERNKLWDDVNYSVDIQLQDTIKSVLESKRKR